MCKHCGEKQVKKFAELKNFMLYLFHQARDKRLLSGVKKFKEVFSRKDQFKPGLEKNRIVRFCL